MGWSIGFDSNHNRDIGYGVPAMCDHPGCGKDIDRGLAYACGGGVVGDVPNCGLFFCESHLFYEPDDEEKEGSDTQLCKRCVNDQPSFEPTPDVPAWLKHKLTDESWEQWRAENPAEVVQMQAALAVRP